MKGYNEAYETNIRAVLDGEAEVSRRVQERIEGIERKNKAVWKERIATNPMLWAEINSNYAGKRLKKKKQAFRKKADAILASNFNINGERYDF